jgi:Tol biopolymer transport system component/tRNA A-37 threonylcarbamoyl transferase component Bud32
MPLSTGTRIGSLEILGPIGAGGMGEVYRARDTKLKRDVALKVLPESFARDPERMARFEREAQILASLNHPNIGHLYGLEGNALVMELVEGESPKGPMPFDEAWKIASQIAGALEQAHDQGIIHRDLKPANIKVTPEGVVKVLDFGLAKAFTAHRETGRAAVSIMDEESLTMTLGATEIGVVLGTASYMAPEQAKGKIVDKRADIWAFGVVLYELLTGQRLFKGADVSDTLAQVLTKQPDLDRVPVKARRLLMRCLERDPKLRLRDIGEAQFLLEDVGSGGVPVRSRPGVAGWVLAGALLVALGLVSFLYLRQRQPERAVLRYTIAVPDSTSNLHSFAISPDGRLVVIAATVGGKRQLWLRPLESLQAQPMPFTEGAAFPFWSPDSSQIGFFAQGKLKKIAASGGPAQSICDADDGRGGSWNRGDVIVFSPGAAGIDIQKVSAGGGVPTEVIGTKGAYKHPVFLPDGSRFLYLVARAEGGKAGIYVASLDGKENRRVLADVSGAVFAPPSESPARANRLGRLLFIRENTLMAQHFDAASASITGDVSPIVEGVSLTTNNHYAPVSVSDNGVLLYESGGHTGENSQIGWYDRSGKLLGPVLVSAGIFDPAISPDEMWVAFRRAANAQNDIWLRDLSRGADQRLTTNPSVNGAPVWSPKGDRLAFASDRGGAPYNLYQKAASGTGQDEQLLSTSNNKTPSQWSRDGRFLVYTEADPKTRQDIWVLPMESGGDRKPVAFLHSEFNEGFGQLSPDSHWMAYTSDESGQREVYVRPFPAGDGQFKISIAGGAQPRWCCDGKEVFFEAADGKLMTVAVTVVAGPKPSFQPGAPHALFDAHMTGIASGLNGMAFGYDVTMDGKRFLIDSPITGTVSVPPLTVVLNWAAPSKR